MATGYDAVLFDLDGTLIDSAPDLAGTANDLRTRRGLPPLALQALRPMVSAGARGMVGAAFGVKPGEPQFEPLREEFLARYAQRLLESTRVFEAMHAVLHGIEAAGLRWGIVTNKAARFTEPIVEGLALRRRAAALVCGDTTAHAKPHPAPLLEAARQLDLHATRCAYVGDDQRDVTAGRAAGMATLVASWGYLGDGPPVHEWGADAILDTPAALLNWLGVA
ncbi:MAG: N-acetylmuramic acid 6-phosphate phosphatase [Burkholderiaceae bacterium]|nr:N-acetylmuramic acid 6-phosphate phosphatase [Burkholderiaceae bacterium]